MGQGQSSILVAVDGSDSSLDAVRYVAGFVRPGTARIHLLHVLEKLPEHYWDTSALPRAHDHESSLHAWEHQQKKAIQAFMERAENVLCRSGHSQENILTLIREREVGIARDLIREARQGYDAVILSRRGMSPLKDLLFGSTAQKLVSRLEDVAVWVVGGNPSTEGVVVGLDRSDGARRTLDYVASFPLQSGTCNRFLLLHVIRDMRRRMPESVTPFIPGSEGASWMEQMKQEQEAQKTEMEAFLSDVVSGWKARGLDTARVETKVVVGPSRSGGIVEEARIGGYGTIVVGRKGLSGVEEFLLGRVSSKVLQMAQQEAVWVAH